MYDEDGPGDGGATSGEGGTTSADPLDRLAASARGWHRIQLAVLGFIGLCGVLWNGGSPSGPDWAQWLTGMLVVLALAVACVAIYLVGRVAFPFYGAATVAAKDASTAVTGTPRLRTGILLTYLAGVVLVVATLSAWWPADTAGAAVEVRDAAGQGWCGQLADAPAGAVALDTSDGPVTLALDRVALIRPVDGC